MQNVRIYIFLLGCFMFGPWVQAQWVSDELVCAEKARLQGLLQFRANNNVYHGYNIHYHRCFWRVNPIINGYLRGNVFSAFTIEKDADSIGFDLKSNMIVDSVVWHKQKIPFTHNGDVLYVFKPGKWQKGSSDSLNIYYQGNPQAGAGFGYYVHDQHMTGPVIHTLSEPYGAAFWWPCKQTLADKIDSIDLFVSSVPQFKAAGNGLLISADSLNDSTRVHHWKHRYPIATYLVAFAVTNYKEFSNYAHFYNRPDSLLILNYVFPQTLGTAKAQLPEILPVMRLYDSLFGNYPFEKEKYGHAQFTWGGGMEHQTMSFMVDFGFDLMAHELAHQWFGDNVTCGSWVDLWLNEGFATYCNALCYRYLKPWEWTSRMAGVRNAATSQDDGSVYAQDTSSVNRLFSGNLTYNKGAFVLHMLRIKVGDAAFFNALRDYQSQNKHGYGFAVTKNLQQIIEDYSGQDLEEFFRLWFRGEGFPYLKINWEQKGSQLRVKIDQTPSHPSVPYFNLQIPIRFRNSLHDTILLFQSNQLSEVYFTTLPFSADSAEFDPEVTVLAKASLGGLNLDKVNTRSFQVAPNPVRDDLVLLSYFNIAEKIEVYSLSGQKVFETGNNFKHSLGENIHISAEGLANGTYVTRIYTKSDVTSLKFIKL